MSRRANAQIEGRLDAVFSALSDPTRRRILTRLTGGPASISELAEPFDMTLPAVSKHLRVLEGAGLLRLELEGRVRRCYLEAAPLESAAEFIARYGRFWGQTLDQLAEHLEAPGPAKGKGPRP